MCLSTLWVNDAAEPAGGNICSIRTEDGKVIATDIMGRVIELAGAIESVDLIENNIRVRTEPARAS